MLGAGGVLAPHFGCAPRSGELTAEASGAGTWAALPFRLDQVRLGDGPFRQKRDRMLHYARFYGIGEEAGEGDGDPFAGPDRLLSIFRANAGLDTRGAEAVGGWEDETGYLRGHYAGHFLTLLAQAWASTSDAIYRRKLDYMVEALGECQAALAAAASRATPRVPGRVSRALRLSGSPLGHAEHVRLPQGLVNDCSDFTFALWIKPSLDSEADLPDRRQTPEELLDRAAIFDFGAPNPEYGEPPLAHLYLTVRTSNEAPGPRFAITQSGEAGEQALQSSQPLRYGEWTHLAVTRSGDTGRLYVDGRVVARNREMTLSPADLGPTPDNWLGRRQFPQRAVSYLRADLDELRIFRRALDPTEIARLASPDPASEAAAAREGLVSPEGTVAHYRFDESDGPDVIDASGNGHDGTVIAPTDGRRHPGFLSAYPETQFVRLEELATYGDRQGIWAPYYTLHKIMAGLLDAHVLAGNERALEIVTGIGDWVVSRITPLEQERLDRMWDIYIAGEYGGINESLANLHALLPERDEYLEASKRFVNNNVFVPTAAGTDALDGRHANQHIPQFLGYLRTWEEAPEAGEEGFYTAARNFWDMVVPHRTYAHGGVGVGEILRARDVIAGSLYDDVNHAETCPLYNLLKLGRQLFLHDPDPKYMNHYELGLFNQMLGSRRDSTSATSPEVTYFVPVQPGRRRHYGNIGTCCGGTGLESHTKYQDTIFFRAPDESRLWVNLYIASTLEWPEAGFTVTLETRLPFEGTASLLVDGDGPLELALRVPAWAGSDFAVRVNGELQALEAVPGTYLTLARKWRRGDRVDVSMPLRFRVEGAIDDPTVQSIYYGPTLLAAQAEPVGDDLETGLLEIGLYRHLKLDGDLASAFVPGRAPLHFSLDGLELAPFHLADPPSADGSPGDAPAAPESGMAQGPDREDPGGRPYHLYLRRREPEVVFGSFASGVANPVTADGRSLLDEIWSEAPFEAHADLVATVERRASEWQASGHLSQTDVAKVLDSARRAEADLRS